MKNDTAEFRIEECVTDVVEQMWEVITSDNDIILDKIETLAEELHIAVGIDAHAELMNRIVKTTWTGLISKIAEELTQLQINSTHGWYEDFA